MKAIVSAFGSFAFTLAGLLAPPSSTNEMNSSRRFFARSSALVHTVGISSSSGACIVTAALVISADDLWQIGQSRCPLFMNVETINSFPQTGQRTAALLPYQSSTCLMLSLSRCLSITPPQTPTNSSWKFLAFLGTATNATFGKGFQQVLDDDWSALRLKTGCVP